MVAEKPYMVSLKFIVYEYRLSSNIVLILICLASFINPVVNFWRNSEGADGIFSLPLSVLKDVW